MRTHPRLIFSFISAVSALAQPAMPPSIGAAGYTAPTPFTIAPGQILTLFVPAVGNLLTAPVKAPPGLIPNTLAGVSAVLLQNADQSVPMPIMEVQPISSFLAVTVQIPFNIQTVCPLCSSPFVLVTQIAVSVNGVTGPFVTSTALADQVHFLTACDLILPGSASLYSESALPCAPMVTHPNGDLVSATNPASSGEELVAYATGLGRTNPLLVTGQAPLLGAPTVTTFAIDFDYRPNALATKPLAPSLTAIVPLSQAPIYTGVTPGFVGLYQINFIVPPVPGGLSPCADLGKVGAYGNVVQSNLTVSVGSVFSFDGAGICVQPGS